MTIDFATANIRSDCDNLPGLLRKISKLLTLDAPVQARFDDMKKIVICMTPRSGSTYLGSLFEANGVANVHEHLRVVGGKLERDAGGLKEKTYEAYIRQKMIEFSAGTNIFGVKCGWNQFSPVYATGMYAHYLHDAHFVYLTRADLLAQAISLYIATEAQYFHTIDDLQKERLSEVVFDFDKISVHLERLIAMQGDWERFFSKEGLQVLRITYEELAADPADVFARICRPLGIAGARIAVATAYEVVRTELNDLLRQQYVAENRRRVAGYIIR